MDEKPFQPMPIPIHPGIEAQKKTAEETEKIRKDTREYVGRLERELQQTRNEFVEYKAQETKRFTELAENHRVEREADEKVSKARFWLSTVIALAALAVSAIALLLNLAS